MDDPIEYYGKCEECKQENTGDKYCKACNVKHFQQNFKNWTSDGFGKVYRAKWIDGYINRWDNINENWERFNSNGFVTLKSLNNSENVTLEFINE
ncbi:kinase-like domain-containing protein [Rhizophagus irregularis DAOM 181602=DAOM 197198]|nr:kinase-like domain-containing protein [Rhizophagus irregularis DAOM 181602=DAOM 197198]